MLRIEQWDESNNYRTLKHSREVLYALSKCDGFLASTLCNGVNIVRAFNEGRFECDDVVREMIMKGEINI